MFSPDPNRPERMRCAIYTRKSTSEGLDQDFTSLDVQRESAEYTIRGRAHEGWEVIPTHYDDGGYTGANLDRPAMQRLLRDIEAGLVDCVVVYKVDRLSRALMDFADLLATFDKHSVTFFSTTQNFDTTNSMGRLTLNILLSFAQFEREMIAERTRDKMGAARKRGKWLGTPPPYGYDGDREQMKLVVNEEEATRLEFIFQFYLETRAIGAVARELNNRDWLRKQHITKQGQLRGGKRWTGRSVLKVLHDPIYIGKVLYKGEIYEGEQPPLIEERLFDEVQDAIKAKACGRGERSARNPEYILSGLLRCGRCDARLNCVGGKNARGKFYRYYVCKGYQNKDCDHPRLSAKDLEAVVIEQIREACDDGTLHAEILAHLEATELKDTRRLRLEAVDLERQIKELEEERAQLLRSLRASRGHADEIFQQRAKELEEQRQRLFSSLNQVQARINAIQSARDQVLGNAGNHAAFEQAWAAMSFQERHEIARLLIQQIIVDEPEGRLEIHFYDLKGNAGNEATQDRADCEDDDGPEGATHRDGLKDYNNDKPIEEAS